MTIEWYGEKQVQIQRCYEFLYDEFKRFYLSYMFPNAFLLNSARSYSLSSSIQSSFASTQHSYSLNVYSNVDLCILRTRKLTIFVLILNNYFL